MQRLTAMTFSFVLLAMTVFVLANSSQFFIPLVVALVIAYMLIAIGEGMARWMPRWLAFVAAVVLLFLGVWLVVVITGRNVATLVDSIPAYQEKMKVLMARGFSLFGRDPPKLLEYFDQIDLFSLAGNIVLTLTEIASFAGMITIYVIFMLIEYQFFDDKLEALVKNTTHREKAQGMLTTINKQVMSYVWIKTWLSLLTAGLSYGVMKMVGVDFAEFWALLIFLLNFIPTFGSIIATLFPCLLTLLQFGEPIPFLLVTGFLALIQFIVGNLVEPRIMGKRFNLSGLVILLSLAIWGQIWGIVGMFLCVPLMMILSIVLANFKQTRPVAIFLSQDGNI